MLVAIVNNYKITEREYTAELFQLIRENESQKITAKLKKLAINHLIDACLLMQESQKYDLQIEEQEVDNYFMGIQEQYSTYDEFLKMMREYSLTTERLIEHIRNNLRIKEFIRTNFLEKIKIDKAQIREYYQKHRDTFKIPEEVKLCHILISNEDPLAFQKINEISNQLFQKHDFCELARNYSDCPSAERGGDLGYIPRGRIVKEIEDVAFSLPIGEATGPIRTRFGYHFIKLMDRRGPRIPEFEEIKDALKRQIKKVMAELELLKFVRDLRSKAQITIYHELL
jgi:parvulin-like peptidyl-prolyl isomerase